MKFLPAIFLLALIVNGCAPKNVPAAPATPTAVEAPKAPDEVKIVTATDLKSSPESIAGEKIYEAKCGRCHGLKKVDDWTAEEWVPIMKSMAPKSRLDSTEKANVTIYVQSHAKGA